METSKSVVNSLFLWIGHIGLLCLEGFWLVKQIIEGFSKNDSTGVSQFGLMVAVPMILFFAGAYVIISTIIVAVLTPKVLSSQKRTIITLLSIHGLALVTLLLLSF